MNTGDYLSQDMMLEEILRHERERRGRSRQSNAEAISLKRFVIYVTEQCEKNIYRSSYRKSSIKKRDPRNFTNFPGKRLCWCLF